VSEANKKQSNECFEVGKKHMLRKEYEQALKHYSNAITHDPHNFKALCNMGSIFREHKEYGEARNCYNKALLEQPKDYITLYNLGNLERVVGCDEIAINHYVQVRTLKEKEGVEMG
jgi:tetratricopeptide (TPR) repeat protein